MLVAAIEYLEEENYNQEILQSFWEELLIADCYVILVLVTAGIHEHDKGSKLNHQNLPFQF